MEPDSPTLNENQVRRLRVTCQHIDKVLSDIEYALNESESRTAFPHYISDISPAQRRTIEDYIARIRGQMVRILDGQGIPRDKPSIPASRTVHVNLIAIDIAIDELRPKCMRGYGEVPSEVAAELNGIVGELHNIVIRLDRYVSQDAAQDLRQRLERLKGAGNDLGLLSRIEQVVADRGLVEYRGTIAAILDRAEDRTFEIAVFGRVSSGKSSLLNAVVGSAVLPVGVTPITAVPTRITYGENPGMIVSFTDASPKMLDLARLEEYATEQQNPGNQKHVTRIVVTVPSNRLREGVTFVDTPGLGSLATTGAAETLAYLPTCDLGIVLVDAGSTLTAEDLQIVLALQEAAIPVQVLLSKVDLLSPSDCEKVLRYVKHHLASEINPDIPVNGVSVLPSHESLLDNWIENQILPLSVHSQELKDESLQRKIGALRESVMSAMQDRLQRDRRLSSRTEEQVRAGEARLRRSMGMIEVTRSRCEREIREAEDDLPEIFSVTATRLLDTQSRSPGEEIAVNEVIRTSLIQSMFQRGEKVRQLVEVLAESLQSDLAESARDLGVSDIPGDDEFSSLVRDMPVFDPGTVTAPVSLPVTPSIFGKQHTEKRLAEQLRRHLGTPCGQALVHYLKTLREWANNVMGQLGKRFELYAERYRAQAERSLDDREITDDEIHAIEAYMRLLGGQ